MLGSWMASIPGRRYTANITVNFAFHSGVKRQLFRNVRLSGSWDGSGQFSNQWTQVPMAASQDETGCDAFNATLVDGLSCERTSLCHFPANSLKLAVGRG